MRRKQRCRYTAANKWCHVDQIVRDHISTENCYKVPRELLSEILVACDKTVQCHSKEQGYLTVAKACELSQVPLSQQSGSERLTFNNDAAKGHSIGTGPKNVSIRNGLSNLPSTAHAMYVVQQRDNAFHELIKDFYEPEVLPEFLESQKASWLFSVKSFIGLCLQGTRVIYSGLNLPACGPSEREASSTCLLSKEDDVTTLQSEYLPRLRKCITSPTQTSQRGNYEGLVGDSENHPSPTVLGKVRNDRERRKRGNIHTRDIAFNANTLPPPPAIPAGLTPADVPIPKGLKDIDSSPFAEHWRHAIDTEIRSAEERGCWEELTWTEASKDPSFMNNRLIEWLWVWKVKSDRDGNAARFRARMVNRGDMCIPNLHYHDVFAPVVSFDTNRTLFAIAVDVMTKHAHADVYQADVSMAFPNAELKETIYAKIPDTHAKDGPDGRPMVWKLKRNVYGLPQGPRNWWECFHEVMMNLPKEHKGVKITQFVSDQCIFKIKKGGQTMWCSLYVDDITMVSTHHSIREWFCDALAQHFQLNEAECGPCEYLLGVKVDVNKQNKTISLSQKLAIEKLVESIGLNRQQTAATPMETGLKLERLKQHESGINEKTCVCGKSFLSVVGSLMYIATSTRPDISFAVNNIARHSSAVGASHVKALVRIVKYLNGTKHLGIVFRKTTDSDILGHPNGASVYQGATHPMDPYKEDVLKLYCDADYAGAVDRKSTTGYVMLVNGAPVVWRSTRQKITAQSTAESEIVSATEAVKDVVHLRLLLTESGFERYCQGPTVVHEDNQACIYLANNLKSRRSAKHFETRLHFLQEKVQEGLVKFEYVRTQDQLADIFTKALPEESFVRLRDRIMGPINDATNTS